MNRDEDNKGDQNEQNTRLEMCTSNLIEIVMTINKICNLTISQNLVSVYLIIQASNYQA